MPIIVSRLSSPLLTVSPEITGGVVSEGFATISILAGVVPVNMLLMVLPDLT